ncbi:MAG TPA: hypothetical protein VHH94_04285 [Gammaproteobacteria bacterium]|nr:hypothetical protein [Gammaproteobacteria bacterium]
MPSILLHPHAKLREEGEREAEAVKRLHLESLLQQEPVGLAHRAAENSPGRSRTRR